MIFYIVIPEICEANYPESEIPGQARDDTKGARDDNKSFQYVVLFFSFLNHLIAAFVDESCSSSSLFDSSGNILFAQTFPN